MHGEKRKLGDILKTEQKDIPQLSNQNQKEEKKNIVLLMSWIRFCDMPLL